MARAVEVFRENGLKVAADDRGGSRAGSLASQAERAAMMVSLQRAFGDVVDAAIAGDFTKRVDAEFPDAELNALAPVGQHAGRDGRSRPGRNRRGAGGAGRDRPDPARARATTRAPLPSSRPIPMRWPKSWARSSASCAPPRARSRPRRAKSSPAPTICQRAHHQAGGDDRGNLGGDGAAGQPPCSTMPSRPRRPASRPARVARPPKRAAR